MNDLRCFLVVAEELNISRAAERVFLSQPAVSRLVRRVERSIGAQLLERSGQTWKLTPAGADFLEHAAHIVADLDCAVARARAVAIDRGPPTTSLPPLRVGVFFPAAAELTRPILKAYQLSAPDVRVQVVDITRLGGEQALTNARVDVAFLWSPVSSSGIASVVLFEDRFALMVADDHELAHRNVLRVADVATQRYTVTMSMSARWQAASTLGPWRRRPDLAVRVSTVTDALRAVRSGRAVSIGPTSLQRYAPVAGISYLAFDARTHPTSLLCSRVDDRRPLVREFVARASDTARRLAPLIPVPR